MGNRLVVVAALLSVISAACSDSTEPGRTGPLSLRFATTAPTGQGGEMVIQGSNGTLRLQDIRLIVSEVELERAVGACVGDDDLGPDPECEDFEGGPFLVRLPLDGSPVTVGIHAVREGSYTRLEFEVENPEPDDDDAAGKRQMLQAILTQLRQTYPSFPATATMVVKGTFTPTGGTAQPFTVYFDAEIEIEMALTPPVTVPGTQGITIMIEPAQWFRTGTQVTNLAALNGQTVSFEAEIEHGFGHVERD